MGALGVMAAKTTAGRWVWSDKDYIAFVNSLDRREDAAPASVRGQRAFAGKFANLVRFVSALIYMVLLWFFAGLAVLVLRDERVIGITVIVIISVGISGPILYLWDLIFFSPTRF